MAATVIGGDQLVVSESEVFGKPLTVEAAVRQLSALSGRYHEVVTALSVWHGGSLHRHADVTRLRMRALDPEEIRRYVERDGPLDCAGSYRIETLGIALIDEYETRDPTAALRHSAYCGSCGSCGNSVMRSRNSFAAVGPYTCGLYERNGPPDVRQDIAARECAFRPTSRTAAFRRGKGSRSLYPSFSQADGGLASRGAVGPAVGKTHRRAFRPERRPNLASRDAASMLESTTHGRKTRCFVRIPRDAHPLPEHRSFARRRAPCQ